ncbi:Acyl-CoA thioesterase [Musa troglodytarum]|uniref:Acyl-CoA thioesterase n=1 Tax=Musa troglodytarum TaxID=320322 RepID=A0A9E7H8Z1_9LILI|nr:Acyl-CoA thioesterase [Musa troglodytarum]
MGIPLENPHTGTAIAPSHPVFRLLRSSIPFIWIEEQRLPSSSLRRIAEVVQVKQYGGINVLYVHVHGLLAEPGEYVVREGEPGLGLYFIWEGQAEVSGSDASEKGNRSELQLKQYDYFGYGAGGSTHQANVVALSKLICLVLPDGYNNLLQPKSIWNAEGIPEDFSLVEHILHLEPIDALAAASKTVDCLKLAHSLHVNFIVAGDVHSPIIYQVHRARDGKSFATRRVDARQHGIVMFTLLCSFQKEEAGFEHQEVLMPNVPGPEMLLSMEELRERKITDPRLPICVVAYASDIIFSGVSLNPHRRKGVKTASLSLDHSVWFHRPVRADDWLLYVIESPFAGGGRGFVTGQMFNRKGEVVVFYICLIKGLREQPALLVEQCLWPEFLDDFLIFGKMQALVFEAD